MTPARICLHGPESTGKSTVGPAIAAHLGGVFVPEYGRDFAEAHGTGFTMADLVTIAQTQQAMIAAAARDASGPLVIDTDPLMTAVWADMLFGRRDPWFDAFADTADLYLLFDVDLPWVADGTRLFGTTDLRRRFHDLSRAELERRGLRWRPVSGQGPDRLAHALAAIGSPAPG